MSDREKREVGNSNSTIKRHFSKKEDTNKIKSNLKNQTTYLNTSTQTHYLYLERIFAA